MAATIKICTVNIEGNKHLADVEAFLQAEKPDVICLQEVFAADIPRLQEKTGCTVHFTPMVTVLKENKYNIPAAGLWGVAILTPHKHSLVQSSFYRGEEGTVPEFTEPNSPNRVVLTTTIHKDGANFRVATTHFTWSGGGLATEEQRQDARRFRAIVDQFEDVIFCGDFNAPRGGEIHKMIGTGFADAVPSEVTTTIDPTRHYAGALELVVDGIFYSDEYALHDCRVHAGVSDHQAIVAEFSK